MYYDRSDYTPSPTLHPLATYGRYAPALDALWHAWSRADNAADRAGYNNALLNERAADLWDTYEEARETIRDEVTQ